MWQSATFSVESESRPTAPNKEWLHPASAPEIAVVADAHVTSYSICMSRVEEIVAAIEKLSLEERARLARWFHGWSDDACDQQMAHDVSAGRLDGLVADVDADFESDRLLDMP